MNLFQRIKETPNQTIKLGDGKALKVARIGAVTLRRSTRKASTLTNVEYVSHFAQIY